FVMYLYLVFFFSSRRRHTRSKRDWSSDVCSSDLPSTPGWSPGTTARRCWSSRSSSAALSYRDSSQAWKAVPRAAAAEGCRGRGRSEERRVGKEGRCEGGRCRR